MPTKVYSSEKYQPILPVSGGGTGGSSANEALTSLISGLGVDQYYSWNDRFPTYRPGASPPVTTYLTLGNIRNILGFNNNTVLAVERGGTGGTTAILARIGLGATSVLNENEEVVGSKWPVSCGGTGATTATAALTALGAAPATHNHAASNITSGTLPVARGGTGASTKSATLLSNIGIYYAATLAAGTTSYPPASNEGCLLVVPAT